MSMELGPYTNFHELNQDWFLNEFNKVLAEWDAMNKSFIDLNAAFIDLRNYVHDYFKNLDVQAEIDNKLNSMVNDGSFFNIIQNTVTTTTTETTTNWLRDNISQSASPVVDKSLKISGAAADSMVTGERTSLTYIESKSFDANNAEWNRFYFINNLLGGESTNTPDNNKFGYLITKLTSGDLVRGVQIYLTADGTVRIYQRYYYGASFTPWKKMKDTIGYVTVGENGDYKKLTDAIKFANDKIIYVDSGIYNLIEEGMDYSNFGELLKTSIIGIGKVKIIANLPEFKENYSPITIFEKNKNITIENVEIECNNCRYGIHIELGGRNEKNSGSSITIKNCTITQNTDISLFPYPRAIGIGFGEGSEISIENCILKSNADSDIDAHSDYDLKQSLSSKLFISNCYLNSTVSGSELSGSTGEKNKIIVTNCNMKSLPNSETMNILQWNNHIR